MIISVPYIIERELLCGRSLGLPRLGVLCLERQGAAFNDYGDILPPYDILVFSEENNDHSFIEVLASSLKENSNVGSYFDNDGFMDNAMEIYNEWFKESLSDDAMELTIDGVCILNFSSGEGEIASLYESFATALLPYGRDGIIPMPKPFITGESSITEIDAINEKLSALEQKITEGKDKPAVQIVAPLEPRQEVRIERVSKFWMVFSIIVFGMSLLYLGYYFYTTLK